MIDPDPDDRPVVCPACSLIGEGDARRIVCSDREAHAWFESVCWREPPADWPNLKVEFEQ